MRVVHMDILFYILLKNIRCRLRTKSFIVLPYIRPLTKIYVIVLFSSLGSFGRRNPDHPVYLIPLDLLDY